MIPRLSLFFSFKRQALLTKLLKSANKGWNVPDIEILGKEILFNIWSTSTDRLVVIPNVCMPDNSLINSAKSGYTKGSPPKITMWHEPYFYKYLSTVLKFLLKANTLRLLLIHAISHTTNNKGSDNYIYNVCPKQKKLCLAFPYSC